MVSRVTEPTAAKKNNPSDKKIYVVDDDELVLSLLKVALEAEGFQVRTGRDGRNMLKKAQEFKPDLIVSDLMMPGGGGYEVLRSLQSDSETSHTPVLIITGSNMASSTKGMLQQESNLAGYLEKPIRPETLLRHVHKILNTISASEIRAQRPNPVNFDDVF